ncbi:MAG: DUF2948 family protein [Gemmobacter sp.]|uniref:DUF2948 family protein n=1 Tax=Gemmobacter sp. TaxID=1898957 RepID=UPI00391A0FDC
MTDARFEDGAERPLRLVALAPDDLPVISALVQDAVFTAADLRWSRKGRRVDVLLNRFRWEDRAAAERAGRPYERVRAVLTVQDVTGLAAQGVVPGDKDTVLSVLALEFTPGADGTGVLVVVLAGDGALRMEVECVNLMLSDVTRPYRAPSGKAPHHPEG